MFEAYKVTCLTGWLSNLNCPCALCSFVAQEAPKIRSLRAQVDRSKLDAREQVRVQSHSAPCDPNLLTIAFICSHRFSASSRL